MRTSYSEVYFNFTNKIRDFYLKNEFKNNPELGEKILFGYLIGAIPRFTYCKQDLSLRDDYLGEFKFTLTEMEKEILATLMLVQYLNPKINSDDYLLRQLGSKDYTQFSPTNQLKELKDLKKIITDEANLLMIEYYYR